jgi:hypothetical protein
MNVLKINTTSVQVTELEDSQNPSSGIKDKA